MVFDNKLLPYLLLAPQVAITLVFFFWPGGQAVYQSFLLQDAFGLRQTFVWFENFRTVLSDPLYLDAGGRTLLFSASVTGLSMSAGLLLAVMIIYRLYEDNARQHMMDMHPMMRKVMGE